MHVVNFTLDLYVSDIDEVIAGFNDGRKYGTSWNDADKHYFAYSYGKARASDDIATIPGSIYANRDGIADQIKSNESPALRKKWEYLRDLCNLYLGQSPMFEILGHQNLTPKKIDLSTSKLNLAVGETQKLTATVLPEATGAKLYYKYDSKIVSVDAEGNITAKNVGSTTITVQAARIKATCSVYVKKATPTPTPKPNIDPNTVMDRMAPVNHPFTDVSSGAYYEKAVIWALNNNITSGTSSTTFSPYATSTRGQAVTFLWRAKGQPEPKSTYNPFIDVKPNDFFYKAVLWAVENGITSGTSANKFSPNETITSDQVVTFLWRSNVKPAATGSSSLAERYRGQYYTDAIAWADRAGLLSGTDITFAQNNNSSRGEIVTYLYRNAD